MALGDSKTATPNTWPELLRASVSSATGREVELSNWGVGGTKANALVVAPFLATAPWETTQALAFLVDFGVNDLGTGSIVTPESVFKSDYLAMIDAVRAKYPYSVFYLARPWRSVQMPNFPDSDAIFDTMAGWIADVAASRPNVFLGHDERVWMRNGDNGVTYTTDGVHYNTAAQAVVRDEWMEVLGYVP